MNVARVGNIGGQVHQADIVQIRTRIEVRMSFDLFHSHVDCASYRQIVDFGEIMIAQTYDEEIRGETVEGRMLSITSKYENSQGSIAFQINVDLPSQSFRPWVNPNPHPLTFGACSRCRNNERPSPRVAEIQEPLHKPG